MGTAGARGGGERDITGRVPAVARQQAREARDRQAERMEAVGQLAGGIAHDFGNLLGVIVGLAGLIAETAGSPAIREDAGQIQAAAQRATQLTRDLLMFSRPEPARPEIIDLNQVLDGSCEVLAASIGERTELRCERAADLPAVLADRDRLEQVLLNLAVNAREAMPEGGTLTFATRKVDLPGGHGGARPGASPVPYVELTVSDTGCGMSTGVLHRIFEPFYTTKPLGLGTGLGLSTVYGIITQAGGTLSVESEEGMGTAVHVYLPAAAVPAPAPPPGEPGPRGDGESILVVDDEPGVLAVTARILRRGGYQAAEAGTCDEALSLMASGDFHLMLADTVMPEMPGATLAERALELKPGLRVLHMSGTAARPVRGRLTRADLEAIQKPFTARALLEKVHAVLGPGE